MISSSSNHPTILALCWSWDPERKPTHGAVWRGQRQPEIPFNNPTIQSHLDTLSLQYCTPNSQPSHHAPSHVGTEPSLLLPRVSIPHLYCLASSGKPGNIPVPVCPGCHPQPALGGPAALRAPRGVEQPVSSTASFTPNSCQQEAIKQEPGSTKHRFWLRFPSLWARLPALFVLPPFQPTGNSSLLPFPASTAHNLLPIPSLISPSQGPGGVELWERIQQASGSNWE